MGTLPRWLRHCFNSYFKIKIHINICKIWLANNINDYAQYFAKKNKTKQNKKKQNKTKQNKQTNKQTKQQFGSHIQNDHQR